MIIPDNEVKTEEVKGWKGLTLINFQGSTCSQKVRIFLAQKGLDYTNRQVNLARHEHVSPWFLGINPRGVVPILVHDGVVHVESNDILEYLDGLPSETAPYFPRTEEELAIAKQSLDLEDSLHVDLRTLTMGFMVPAKLAAKDEKTLQRWEADGVNNPSQLKQVKWWREFAENGGVSDEVARASIANYRKAFETLESWLDDREYLLGDRLSVLDITWFISANRLKLAGYPLDRHKKLFAWYQKLERMPAFAKEVASPPPLGLVIKIYGAWRKLTGTSMVDLEKAA